MLTSAGCNALDYLLDNPKAIYCVDVNPRQNALLELKKASLEKLDFRRHFALFGEGHLESIQDCYRQTLRPVLPNYAQRIWDKSIQAFNGKGVRKSFYYHGTSGFLAWLLIGYCKRRPSIKQELERLFASPDLVTQLEHYRALEPKLINQLVRWLANQHLTMCLIGVPRAQQELFREKYEEGAVGFLRESLERVFTQHPIVENYFWQLYFRGKYQVHCSPNYLQSMHFYTLQDRQQRISTYNSDLTNFLCTHPRQYSHYVLLDHQDWLAEHDIPALVAEWKAILDNSRSGTKILLRSAAEDIDFIPDFVLERVQFVGAEEMAPIHRQDRVGTYASVHLGIVQ